MQIPNKQVGTPTQSWTNRATIRSKPKVDYYSELASWLQHAILEAEKNKNFNKKDQLSILLEEL